MCTGCWHLQRAGGRQGGDKPSCTTLGRWAAAVVPFYAVVLQAKDSCAGIGTRDYLLIWCFHYGALLFATGHSTYRVSLGFPPNGRDGAPTSAGDWPKASPGLAVEAGQALPELAGTDVSQSQHAVSRWCSRLCRGCAHLQSATVGPAMQRTRAGVLGLTPAVICIRGCSQARTQY